MAKPGALPLAFRISSRPTKMPIQFNAPKPLSAVASCHLILGSNRITTEQFQFLGSRNCMKDLFLNYSLLGTRSFSSSIPKKGAERSGQKPLPWLAASMERKRRQSVKNETSKGVIRSSWEEAAEKFLKGGGGSTVEESSETRRFDSRRRNEFRDEDDTHKKFLKGGGGSMVESRETRKFDSRRKAFRDKDNTRKKFVKGDGGSMVESRETRRFDSRRNEFRDKDDTRIEDEGEEVEDEGESINDPRWYNIRKRYDNYAGVSDRPEFRRWDKQESWGRKTWNEAKESSLPKIVGEGIYGVGPVLAALSAGRRELYALYVQEGLDLSTNNKKKKDKKGFERALKMAEKLGLTKKEISKHDLNMITDNRPHQGLVLDASPLEMVGIKELEPVSIEDENAPLWLALDEVTDPQNLGAIIRSAYFFGASGVVLCAKNSAPLSGVVSKSSAGSLELMELRSCKNMMQFLTSSAENGWRVLGGSVSPKAIPLSEVEPGVAPTVLVLGSEGTGLRPLVERSCTQLVRIAGNPTVDMVVGGDEEDGGVENSGREFKSFLAVESLNVSVAAGVLLNHLIGSRCDGSGDVRENKAV